ncbi:CopD family protein [Azospirillum picis]|uniref:Protoporphyrinogen IX oxidase n=1 Tax=Azospirillum picis TaxID=488438 RepID=A0ABU0MR02_9PROT|nr:CopD family protein [Azospirillum picis]MBP2302060.1 putative membrane protein [Azospirillum picis]MDQ0535649.1 putative membrane protein [Azospirillum picis]
MDYMWLMGLHILAVVVWIGGMFGAAVIVTALATPAHAPGAPSGPSAILSGLHRWDRRVTTPAMGLAWLLGVTLVIRGGWFGEPWLMVKLVVVIALSALHGRLARALRTMAGAGGGAISTGLRFAPLAIVAAVIAVITLVVVKPF